jgi:chemotaxis protein methyltransferase CheR
MMNLPENISEAQTLAQAIVNTIPEPFLVLDDQFRVLAASRSFYHTFKVDDEDTRGCLLYALGDGQWDIPALRLLLETIIPEQAEMEGFEVEHDFPGVGRKTMLLDARKVLYEDSSKSTILLAFTDITARRVIEMEKEALLKQTEELLHQKHVLLQEMQHRVANSLQIIASILMLKARAVASGETRQQLEDAHRRVMSVATVQLHLHPADNVDQIEVAPYLSKLCASLAASMIGETQPITIEVSADDANIDSAQAVSLGLIVTELVINAVKYAFPDNRAGAVVKIAYRRAEAGWALIVSDNGIGKDATDAVAVGGGLGTAIVMALAKQLDARVETVSSAVGMTVSVSHTKAASNAPPES